MPQASRPLRAALSAALVLSCLQALTASAAERGGIEATVARQLKKKELSKATIAVKVVDTKSGATLYERMADRPLLPASNQKLLTSVAALELLGKDFEFKTTIACTGTLRPPELAGNLVLVGGGDPNLSGRFFGGDPTVLWRRWGKTLRERGIQRITGDIVCDARLFSDAEVHPGWPDDQLTRWYCAAVSALAANDDCVLLVVKPGAKTGDDARVTLEPDVGYLKLDARCATGGKDIVVHVERLDETRTLKVTGRVPAKLDRYALDVAVPQPALFAGAMMADGLKSAGITLGGAVRAAGADEDVSGAVPLIVFKSDLPHTLEVMNGSSQNFYAESVFKSISASKTGRGSWAESARLVTQWALQAGLKDGQFTVSDGSGMSRENRLSAEALTTLLVRAHGAPYADILMKTLPVGGETGTLEKRFASGRYKGKVRAKTGYISGVGALSGYAETRSGRLVAFSVLINDWRGGGAVKYAIDEIVQTMIDEF